ncbi:unnamed protein product, partial [Cyprideis torosa]
YATAKHVDRICRIAFPLSFGILNILYWSVYVWAVPEEQCLEQLSAYGRTVNKRQPLPNPSRRSSGIYNDPVAIFGWKADKMLCDPSLIGSRNEMPVNFN